MQGTPVSNLSEGRATVDYFNEVGYTAAALGNHEFDWGIDVLRQRIAEANFAWLGANIYMKGTDTLPELGAAHAHGDAAGMWRGTASL
jgi:2',3'-cyclic-nucleotide 2'-phosphodiesterase / 3'-nucleotidase / 5'-nucleotidase